MSQRLLYVRRKPYPERKVRQLREFMELLRKYKRFIIFKFENIPAPVMQEIRTQLWGRAVVKVIKNTLARKAIEFLSNEKPELKKLLPYLKGMNAYIFLPDSEDPFEIARWLETFRVKLPLRPGLICPIDIIIPRGPTGLRAGPETSELRAAGMDIRVIDGEIFVWKEFVLARKGERLSDRQVKVMKILDINPFEAWPRVELIWDDGVIIPRDIALRPKEEWEKEVEEALKSAINLAVNAYFPAPEIAEVVARLAYLHALNIAIEAGIPTPESAELIVTRALTVARLLADHGFELAVAQAIQLVKEVLKEVSKQKPDLITEELKKLIEA